MRIKTFILAAAVAAGIGLPGAASAQSWGGAYGQPGWGQQGRFDPRFDQRFDPRFNQGFDQRFDRRDARRWEQQRRWQQRQQRREYRRWIRQQQRFDRYDRW